MGLNRRQPDLIISDYRLGAGKTGVDAIENLRAKLGAPIPAFLMSGETAPDKLREVTQGDYFLLSKPVAPITLRAMLNRLLNPPAGPDNPQSVRANPRRRRPETPARPPR
jgi:CheY-like chemotaxis protein